MGVNNLPKVILVITW